MSCVQSNNKAAKKYENKYTKYIKLISKKTKTILTKTSVLAEWVS